MWKKIRESTSGINLNFISSLMRKRRYSKFDEDACAPLNGHLHDERTRRDEDNNKVSWTSSSKRRTDNENGNVFIDTGYRTVKLKVSDNNGNRNSRRPLNPRLSEPFKSDYGSTNIPDDVTDCSYGYGSDSSDNEVVTHHEFYQARKNGIRTPSSVKDDLTDFVNSLVQRRYQKLGDSHDEIDDVFDCDDRQVSIRNRLPKSASQDSDNLVFHSIKDVEPKWEEKPKKSKKRRKVHVLRFLRRASCLSAGSQYGRTDR